MEQDKKDDNSISDTCFARKSRRHCSHYEEDGYCCLCKCWAPEMCPKGCGQLESQHAVEACTPLFPEEDLKLEFLPHIRRQQAFSIKNFGPPGLGQKPEGVIDHIKKEIAELELDTTNLKEWVDLIILSFDGALKACHSPEEIVRALKEKQTKNERRKWPDWRTMPRDRAIEHVRTEEEARIKAQELKTVNPGSFDANDSPTQENEYQCVSCGESMGNPHLNTCKFY